MKKILSLIISVSCGLAWATPEQAWQSAPVYLPGKFWTTTVDRVQIPQPLPLVIYLHGCTGITSSHDRRWAKFLSEQGYAVIMPDSFAREGRRSVCDPQTHSFDRRRFPEVYDYRHAEITYSLERAQQLAWVDPTRIYVMGHSEGAYAVSKHGLDGARAAIISGHTCGGPRGHLVVNREIPLLNILFARDPWFHGTWRDGRCRQWRDTVEETVVDGAEHDTFSSSEMRQAVIQFLSRHAQ